jgi:putative methionine-R-sulfoxide reductase with GAF domain
MTAGEKLVIIDGLTLSNWNRELLLELHKGQVTCVHVCVGNGIVSSRKIPIW